MAKNGYKLDVSKDAIRMRFKPGAANRVGILLVGLLVSFVAIKDLNTISFLCPLIVLGFSVVAAIFLSGEVLVITPKGIEYAHRRWNRWMKGRVERTDVTLVGQQVRSYGRSTTIFLRIETRIGHSDHFKDAPSSMFLDLMLAARDMGYPTNLDMASVPMLKDIAKRGWFVNPLKPDPPSGKSITD